MFIKKIPLVILFLSFFSFSFVSAPGKVVAVAKVEFKRVMTDDTPFYTDINASELLFYLPSTYYVKILSENNGLAHVECFSGGLAPALDGYVPSEFLVENPLYSGNPFLNLYITSTSSCILYSDPSLSQNLQYVFAGREMFYYGIYTRPQGENLFLVYYNGKLGYVKESGVMPFTVTPHPDPMPQPEQPEEQNSQTQNNTPFDTIRTAIIVCLVLAGIVALLLILKKKNKPVTVATYYDDNDYV